MSWIKQKFIGLFLKDYINDYVKPITESILKFFNGKKVILSFIAFSLAQYALANPGSAVSVGIAEVLHFLQVTYGITPSIEGISATAVIGLAIGFFDKLKKWATSLTSRS